jgi:hypothetical protein
MTALRAIFAIGLAAFWLLLAAPPMFQTPLGGYTGTHALVTGAPFHQPVVAVDRGSPAYRAGLRTGDVLGCLSLRDANLLLQPLGQQGYRPGTPISTCVTRLGTTRTIRFVARPGPALPNYYGGNLTAALRLCVVLTFFLTGIALLTLRPSLMTWIFYAYCLCNAPSFSALVNSTILPAWQYAIVAGFTGLGTWSAVAFLLLFAVLVPNDRIPQGWRRTAFWISSIVALIWVSLGIMRAVYTGVIMALPIRYDVDEALTAATILVVVARLVTMERMERARFGWAAFAIIFGVVANDVRNVFAAGHGWTQELSIVASVLTVVMPIALVYAILRRHVIDVRFVISRTVVYAIITTLVVGLIGVVDWATSVYLHEARFAMALDALVTIALGFLLHRTYRWLEYAVDFFLFRRKHEGEAYLQRLARTLSFAQTEESVDHALVDAPCDKFDLVAAALFRLRSGVFAPIYAAGWNTLELPAFERDDDAVRFLMAEHTRLYLTELHARVHGASFESGTAPAVAIPIFEGNSLTGFALYALHRDGTKLDPDELETLERLCETAAQAYTGIELAQYRSFTAPSLAAETL